MNELKWVPWGRNGYATYWPSTDGVHYRLAPVIGGWLIYRLPTNLPGMAPWRRLPKMFVSQAKQAAALMIMMGGSDE